MEMITLGAEIRTEKGKGPVQRLRKSGMIPAVLYGHGEETRMLQITRSKLLQLLEQGLSFSTPLSLTVNVGDESTVRTVFVKEMRQNPLSEEPLHIDFYSVAPDQKVTLPVSVIGKGKPAGVEKGGLLQQTTDNIMVEGLVPDVPRSVEIDISSLLIGDTLTVATLQLPENVRILDSADKVLFHLLAPRKVYAEE